MMICVSCVKSCCSAVFLPWFYYNSKILKIIIDKTKKKRNNNCMHTIFTNTLNVVLVFNSN